MRFISFPVFALALSLGASAVGSIGCVAAQKQVKTPHFSLSYPDYWELKNVGMKDGDPTTVMVKSFGSAVIDEGSGSMGDKQQNYEAVQADVETRVYAWPEPQGVQDPTRAVAQLLQGDSSLELPRHLRVGEQPPECGLLKKKYTVAGDSEEPLDLVSRPGWRTIVVGGKKDGVLLGIVARVPYEQDVGRFCHNLSNMQVQLQNLLEGLVVTGNGAPMGSPPATPAQPPATPGPQPTASTTQPPS